MQQLGQSGQVLVLARLAEGRSATGRFSPAAINEIYDHIGLPRPSRTANVVAALGARGLLARLASQGTWRLTPAGKTRSAELVSDMDLVALTAEASAERGPSLGSAIHPVITPEFAPPALLQPLRGFLDAHPFDRNVFGMTRFPDEQSGDAADPLAAALEGARDACEAHGLEFHLASDRSIVDDLWANVTAHMWASRYGVAFFEDIQGRGLNYNLTIEVGSMLMAGRRCALLKDATIERLPTDLVGKIYKPVAIDDSSSVSTTLHAWLRDDLSLGPCAQCPSKH